MKPPNFQLSRRIICEEAPYIKIKKVTIGREMPQPQIKRISVRR